MDNKNDKNHINRITVEFKLIRSGTSANVFLPILIESEWNLNKTKEINSKCVCKILIESQWNLNLFPYLQ